MNKSQLIQILQNNHDTFMEVIGKIPPDLLDGAIVSGIWSVKHIISHINYYEEWFADRLEEQINEITYTPTKYDSMHFEERNLIIHEQTKDLSVDEVLMKSKMGFDKLLTMVKATPEEFLIEPQNLGGPEPVLIWEALKYDVYDHYLDHTKILNEWLRNTTQ